MNVPKRQHTVPRVYLENFTDEDNRLTLFSKRQKKLLRPFPANALVRHYYYSQPSNGILNAEHGIETDLFNDLETKYPAAYDQAVSGKILDKPDAVDVIGQFIPMLRARSPAFREAFELGLADFVKPFAHDAAKRIPAPEGYGDLASSLMVTIDPHRSLIAMAHYLKHYMIGFTEMSFVLASPASGMSFLTSDNPFIWFDPGPRPGLENIYPNEISSQTRAFFPLSPNFGLWGRKRKNDEDTFRNGSISLPRRRVHETNKLQVGCAWDAVVGCISLPSRLAEYFSSVAPRITVQHFNSADNTFVLGGSDLAPIRDKPKFDPSGD